MIEHLYLRLLCIENLNLSLDYYNVDINDKIIKSRSLPVFGDTEFSELSFYTNAIDMKVSGIDFVATYTLKWGTKLGIAINSNQIEVTSQNKVNGLDPVLPLTVFNLENNLPELRASVNVDHRFSNGISLMFRLNHYGETTDERSTQEKVDPAQLIDIELSYKVSDKLSIVFGANNILNVYPTEIETRVSQGMPYPRRSPLGYNGGILFTRLAYNF